MATGVVLVMVALTYRGEIYKPITSKKNLYTLLLGNCWVTYDPQGWNPEWAPDVDLNSVRKDLRKIRAAGFTGVVTFSSKGQLHHIPRLAKEEGLAVITGVWDPTDVLELDNAISQYTFSDAYNVGHNGLDKPNGYSFEEMAEAVDLVKRRTDRPVTTTEELRFYDPRLVAVGDWLSPDIHLALIQKDRDVEEDVATSIRLTKVISETAASLDRPLMLKMVTYPRAGVEGTSRQKQRDYFEKFLGALRSPELGSRVRAGFAVHSAFDLPWKVDPPFYPWDPYTGVLEPDGSPRPVVKEIVGRCKW